MTDQPKPEPQGGDGLLPCPCCKSPGEASTAFDGSVYEGHVVICTSPKCGCQSGVFPTPAMAKRAWNTRAVDCSYCGSPAPNHNLGCPVALDELMEKRAAPPQPAPDAVRERAAVALLEVRNFEGETIARFKQSNDVMWREALQSADTVLAALAPPLPSGEPLVKGQISEIIRELREEYPALDVTTVVFCKDFAGVACCVIPHARVMAIIEALSQFARPVGRTRGPS